MDISFELSALAARIAQITGAPAPALRDPLFTGPETSDFAALVAQALDSNDAATASPGGPEIVPTARVNHLVRANAVAWGVDPALVKAIIANESGFDATATSPTGAQGLMQLEPATAAELGVTDAYDPEQNIWGGTRYIRGLLDRFHGNIRLAVAAYNAGPGAVEKYGGVPPYVQTQNYVDNVLDSYRKYRTTQ